jgi:heme a synthase
MHRYAVFVAVCTALLVFAGGLVTSTGSALSVPDWPLSYGMLFPPMVGNVRFEHGHRLLAGSVGMLTLGLAAWLLLREPRRAVRRLGLLAVAAVILQGVLGGLTVLLLLPPPVSIAHASLGQTFFCIVVSIALLTSPGWKSVSDPRPAPRPLPTLAAVLCGLVFVQLLVGATMRHTGAGLAIPDFPLAFGRMVPPLDNPAVALHFAHRVLGLVVALAAALVAGTAIRQRVEPTLLRPAALALALVLVQIGLGGVTVLSRKAAVPATLHVLNGALILATSLVLALRSYRGVQRSSAGARLRAQDLAPRTVGGVA